MSEPAASTGLEPRLNGLRERNVQTSSKPTKGGEVASQSLGDKLQVEEGGATDSEKKTFGRTPDGTGELPSLCFLLKNNCGQMEDNK